ncbi:MAG: hypothetical protein ACP5LD_03490, partial [Desulfomonilaceae bacterium]
MHHGSGFAGSTFSRMEKPARAVFMTRIWFLTLLLCLSNSGFALDEKALKPASAVGLAKPESGSAEAAFAKRLKISPFGRIGFQRMGMELLTPMPFVFSLQNDAAVGGGSLALRIREMTLWVVEGGIEAHLVNDLRLFVIGSGNLMQRIALNMAPDLVDSITLSEWRRNDLRWITLESGVERDWKGPLAILGGLRWDHFLLVVKEPVRPEGRVLSPNEQVIPSGAEVSANFLIPYAGIGVRSGSLKAQAILGAPPYCKIFLTTRFSQRFGSSENISGIADVDFLGVGGFLELSGQYTATVHKKFHLTLWGRAAILGSRGKGDAEIRYVSADPASRIKAIDTEHTVRFFRHSFTGGIAFDMPF